MATYVGCHKAARDLSCVWPQRVASSKRLAAGSYILAKCLQLFTAAIAANYAKTILQPTDTTTANKLQLHFKLWIQIRQQLKAVAKAGARARVGARAGAGADANVHAAVFPEWSWGLTARFCVKLFQTFWPQLCQTFLYSKLFSCQHLFAKKKTKHKTSRKMNSVYIEICFIHIYVHVAKVSFEHQVYGYLLILQIVSVLIDGYNRRAQWRGKVWVLECGFNRFIDRMLKSDKNDTFEYFHSSFAHWAAARYECLKTNL